VDVGRTRIAAHAGVTQVVKVRLEPSPAQVALLSGYCGTARAAYNTLLYRVKANLAQRDSERSYGLASEELTPALSWHKFGLEKLLRTQRKQWLPWWADVPWQVLDAPAHQLAVALGRFNAGHGGFPTFKKKHGAAAGLVPVTFRDTSVAWLGEGGRELNLPISMARRRELGAAAATKLSRVRMVKDNRARKAAKLVRDGHGQVQTVTYSFSGGYWWAAIRLRVLPAIRTASNRRRSALPVTVVGIDAGMGRLFATLSTPITDVTDAVGHIASPRYLRHALADLAIAQAWLRGTTIGSRRHRKALLRVQKLHGRVASRRNTFHHQLAIAIVESSPLVGVETLNLRGMARRKNGYRFGFSVGDAAYSKFVDILTRQAAKRGSLVVAAPRFYPSSKSCSRCGAVKTKLLLSERTYECTTCDLVLDRDVNAAVNLAAYALAADDDHQHDGVSDAGEASSRQTPPPRGAAAFGCSASEPRPVTRRVPDPNCAAAQTRREAAQGNPVLRQQRPTG
jgi:putative transposase